jgi:hypothetical protein
MIAEQNKRDFPEGGPYWWQLSNMLHGIIARDLDELERAARLAFSNPEQIPDDMPHLLRKGVEAAFADEEMANRFTFLESRPPNSELRWRPTHTPNDEWFEFWFEPGVSETLYGMAR